jgi:copper resistance protein D
VTIAFGLIVSRFLHYLAAAVLFGAAALPLYVRLPHPPPNPLRQAEGELLRRLLLIAAIVALLSAVSWLAFTAASMSGSAAGALDPAILSLVLTASDFGHVWAVRLALAAMLIVLLLKNSSSTARAHIVAAGALLLIGSIALTGHAWADANGGWLHVGADALHLAAAGLWIGALIVLVVLAREQRNAFALQDALVRFSKIGTLLVAVLIASGLINSWFLIGPEHVLEIFTSAYGFVLSAKIALFFGMLIFAAINRYRLTPALAEALKDHGNSATAVRSIRTSVGLETLLGVLVLFAVGWLGTLVPPLAAE